MSSRWNRGNRRGKGRSVPLETAEKIARQRDRLAEEVREQSERIDELKEALAEERRETDRDGATREELRERAEAAEERARDLEERLEEMAVDEDASEEGGVSEDEARRLRERIASLRDEVERLRRRAERAADEARRDERIRLLSGLGDALESIERGLSMHPEGPEREGLEAIYSQLLSFLQREGATLTGEVGEEMDPEYHEAIEVVDAPEAEARTIVDVARRGVVLEDGSVVLPAKVQVAR